MPFRKLILFINLIVFSTSCLAETEKLKIKKIVINGNNITKNETVLEHIAIKKNQIYSLKQLIKNIQTSEENLNNLQIFNDVEISFWYTQEDEIQIEIFLTERWYLWPFPIFEISDRNFNSWYRDFKESNYEDWSKINYGIMLDWQNFRGANELIKLKFRKGYKEHYNMTYATRSLGKNKSFFVESEIDFFRRKKTDYLISNNQLQYLSNDNDFTSTDLIAELKLINKKEFRISNSIFLKYHRCVVDNEINMLNRMYLNSSNKNNIGSYFKLSYSFKNEQRDNIQYPLDGSLAEITLSKNFGIESNINNSEINLKLELHKNIYDKLFFGSSLKTKISSNNSTPYFYSLPIGFNDYIRSYEYYVISGNEYLISKNILKYQIFEKTKAEIPFFNKTQFKKSHYSMYVSLFCDVGYVRESERLALEQRNNLSNSILIGRGLSLDFITYYDKILRIEFSVNKLGEKGIFLHFSNPFGDTKVKRKK